MLTNEEMIHLEKILSDDKDLFEKIQKDQKDLKVFLAQEQKRQKNQMEGIKKAKEMGIHLGRPQAKINKKVFNSIAALFESNQISSRQAAKSLNIAQSTFLRYFETYKKERGMK